MKILMIIGLALVLLGGGGAGAYFYFKQPAEAASGATGEHGKVAKPKKGGHGDGAHAGVFVQLDPLILPIIDRSGVTQTVSLVVVIATTDDAIKQEITAMAPRLKDAFIQDMYGVLSQENTMKNGVIQVTALKDRLHKVSNRVLGEGKATEVLLQVVQQRPL